MFYQFEDDIVSVAFENLSDNVPSVGYVGVNELCEIYKALHLPLRAVEMCREDTHSFSSCIDVYDDCYFMKIGILGKSHGLISNAGIFAAKNLLLIVNISEKDFINRDLFMRTISKSGLENAGTEKLLLSFFDCLASMDKGRLDELRNSIDLLEETVINDKTDDDFNVKLLEIKKRILSYRNYYENLIDIAQILSQNDNELFDKEIKHLSLFTDKAVRMRDNIDILTDSVVHLWDAYQASLNMRLNKTMKVFTLVTTVFFPLTVIVGWYGMNFKSMPEFDWRYGYIYVIIFSLAVVGGLILWFKKRKWI